MKKISYLLAIIMVVSLIGCTSKPTEVTTSSKELTSSDASSKQSVESKASSEAERVVSSEASEIVSFDAPLKEETGSNLSSAANVNNTPQATQKSSQLSVKDSNRNFYNDVLLDEKNAYFHTQTAIYSIDRNTSEQKLIYDTGENLASFTTDGTHIFFNTKKGLYRIKNDGSEVKFLSDDENLKWKRKFFIDNNVLYIAANGVYGSCKKAIIDGDNVSVLDGFHLYPAQEKWAYSRELSDDATEMNLYKTALETGEQSLVKHFTFKGISVLDGIPFITDKYVIYYDKEKSNRDYVNEQVRKGVFLDYDHYFSIYDPSKNLENRLSVADKTSYVSFANYDKEWLYFFEGLKIYRAKYDGTEKQNIVKSHQGLTHISVVDGWIYFYNGRRVKADGSDIEEKLMGFE